MNLKIKFFTYEWDNYQGGSGRVIKLERIIALSDETKLSDVKEEVIKIIGFWGYNDDWGKHGFTGRGIISITIN